MIELGTPKIASKDFEFRLPGQSPIDSTKPATVLIEQVATKKIGNQYDVGRPIISELKLSDFTHKDPNVFSYGKYTTTNYCSEVSNSGLRNLSKLQLATLISICFYPSEKIFQNNLTADLILAFFESNISLIEENKIFDRPWMRPINKNSIREKLEQEFFLKEPESAIRWARIIASADINRDLSNQHVNYLKSVDAFKNLPIIFFYDRRSPSTLMQQVDLTAFKIVEHITVFSNRFKNDQISKNNEWFNYITKNASIEQLKSLLSDSVMYSREAFPDLAVNHPHSAFQFTSNQFLKSFIERIRSEKINESNPNEFKEFILGLMHRNDFSSLLVKKEDLANITHEELAPIIRKSLTILPVNAEWPNEYCGLDSRAKTYITGNLFKVADSYYPENDSLLSELATAVFTGNEFAFFFKHPEKMRTGGDFEIDYKRLNRVIVDPNWLSTEIKATLKLPGNRSTLSKAKIALLSVLGEKLGVTLAAEDCLFNGAPYMGINENTLISLTPLLGAEEINKIHVATNQKKADKINKNLDKVMSVLLSITKDSRIFERAKQKVQDAIDTLVKQSTYSPNSRVINCKNVLLELLNNPGNIRKYLDYQQQIVPLEQALQEL